LSVSHFICVPRRGKKEKNKIQMILSLLPALLITQQKGNSSTKNSASTTFFDLSV